MREIEHVTETKILNRFPKWIARCSWVILCLGLTATDIRADVKASFLYHLSNFTGPIPYNWANIVVDEDRNEVYVVDPQDRDVRIFNERGMEVYRFGDDGSLGLVVDIAVEKSGDMLVLSRRGPGSTIILCDFRGERKSDLALKNLPSGFSEFSPHRMVLREGRLYLLDEILMRIVVTDTDGLFQDGYDLVPLLDVVEEKRGSLQIEGFTVDQEGNMLFTIPVLFSAYKLSADRKIVVFGKPGGAPGGFGIAGGIVSDQRGNVYVADRLKCVVLIFDSKLNFLKEFGYRGVNPENLIGPRELALDRSGRLYVSQLRERGISVFKISYN